MAAGRCDRVVSSADGTGRSAGSDGSQRGNFFFVRIYRPNELAVNAPGRIWYAESMQLCND